MRVHRLSSRSAFSSALIAILLLLSSVLGIAGLLLAETGPPPPPVSEAELKREQRQRDGLLRDVFFLTPRRGFAVSQGGVVLTTEDGGASWRQEHLPQNDDVWQVTFPDSTTGWIIAGYSTYQSRDGGRTWVRHRIGQPVYPYFRRLRFVNSQVAWLVGKDVYVSRDGGATWTSRRPFGTVDLYDIACFTTDLCIAVGDHDAVLTTSDGGRTWIRGTLPILEPHIVRRVQITSDGIAWALAFTNSIRESLLVRSTDRGKTWTMVAEGEAAMPMVAGPNDFHFWDGKRGILAGTEMLLTSDGGASFRSRPGASPGTWLGTLFFLNEKLGWAAGQFQTITHTQDGGQTWTLQHKETPVRQP